jgi:hypothetical protein
MNRADQDRLLREILSDDPAEFRRASLENSLAALRRRRRQRRAAGVGLAACAVVAGLLLALPQVRRDSTIAVAQFKRPAPADSAPPADAAPAIKVLNDDELLALFPNRPVGLIGSPGHQTLVFFDTLASQ